MVSHAELFDVAVHPQPAPVVTPTVPEPPAARNVCDGGAIENVHGAACCVTVNVCPPIEMLPLRAAAALAATLKTTTPFPVPDDPAVTVIHGAFDTAVQAQPAPAVTFVRASPPPAATSMVAGDSEKPHGAAACVTVKVWAAIVAVPVRAAPELAATFSVTVPVPVPVAPEATVIQPTLAAAVHAHDPPVDTVMADVPPAADIASLDGLIE
jgi:hypothetical protein